MEHKTCDYCGDVVTCGPDELTRCQLCWEHHYNLFNDNYAAKNPIPPHKAEPPTATTSEE